MNPTIKDVAKQANTSKSTVSRFLNGQRVKKKTEEAIAQAIKELNYHPNMNARRLASSRTLNIGIVVDDISNYFYSTIISEIEVITNQHGYQCVFFSRKSNKKQEKEYLNMLYEGEVDGLIMVSFYKRDEDLIAAIQEIPYPIILIGDDAGCKEVHSVDVDNYSGTYELVEYLHQIGHHNIAYIAGPDTAAATHQRMAGYRAALQTLSIEFRPEWIVSSNWSKEGGYEAMMQLLERERRGFTAVIASNDEMAIGALRAANDRGFHVPQDFSLIGFDDIPMSAWVNPGLTTANQPLHQIGRRAAEMMMELLKTSEMKYQRHLFKTNMVIRQSCRSLV